MAQHSKGTRRDEYILHEGAKGYRCPVCGRALLTIVSEFQGPCPHVRLVSLDLADEPFYRSRKPAPHLVVYTIDDMAGPFGGRLTLSFAVPDGFDDPQEAYWRHNRDQTEFEDEIDRETAEATRQRAQEDLDREAELRKDPVRWRRYELEQDIGVILGPDWPFDIEGDGAQVPESETTRRELLVSLTELLRLGGTLPRRFLSDTGVTDKLTRFATDLSALLGS